MTGRRPRGAGREVRRQAEFGAQDVDRRRKEDVELELIGRTSIHPLFFYSGKICGYAVWVLLVLDYLGIQALAGSQSPALEYLSFLVAGVAVVFIAMSFVNLGRSVRLGLPTGGTRLKTHGIYQLSRNPMYVGFNLLTVAGILGIRSAAVLALGVYSIVVYHFIIRGEERYLESAFGAAYAEYRARVRRYL